MTFTMATLSELCTMTATSLRIMFPDFAWVVLPDINPDKSQVGFYISASVPGTEKVIMARPMVNIMNPWEITQPEFLGGLIEAFKKEMEKGASTEVTGGFTTPLVPKEFTEDTTKVGKKRGRPFGSRSKVKE